MNLGEMIGLKKKNKSTQVQRKPFEELLNGIKTEEGKLRAILMAVERNATHDPAHLDVAINHYLQENKSEEAARVVEKKGDIERAIELYIMADNLWSAESLTRRITNTEVINKVNLLLAERYEKKGDYENSAYYYKKIGNKDKFKEMFDKRINHLKEKGAKDTYYLRVAAELAKKYGNQKLADEFYDQTIAGYEEKGDIDVVAEVKRERGDIAGARALYIKMSDLEEAKGNFRQASYWLEKAEEKDCAQKLSELACLLKGD